MIVANIVAQKLNKPFSTPDSFLEGYAMKGNDTIPVTGIEKVLLLDESIGSGRQLRRTLARLRSAHPNLEIISGLLLPNKGSRKMVDHYYKVIPTPRYFEWEVMHNKKFKSVAFDFDGVLCEDCPQEVDYDEDQYRQFLENAKPYLVPHFEIDYIVSNRLEKYRDLTEAWLKRHGVRYRHLVLWDIDDKDKRLGGFAANKINQVLRLKPRLFVESSYWQSRQIAFATGIPVLCTDRHILFG